MIAFVYKSLYVIFFFCIHSIKKRLYLYQYFISRLWIISGLYKKGENIGCFSLSSSFAWSVALTVLHWFCCQSSMFTALFTHVTLAFLSWRGFIEVLIEGCQHYLVNTHAQSYPPTPAPHPYTPLPVYTHTHTSLTQ